MVSKIIVQRRILEEIKDEAMTEALRNSGTAGRLFGSYNGADDSVSVSEKYNVDNVDGKSYFRWRRLERVGESFAEVLYFTHVDYPYFAGPELEILQKWEPKNEAHAGILYVVNRNHFSSVDKNGNPIQISIND